MHVKRLLGLVIASLGVATCGGPTLPTGPGWEVVRDGPGDSPVLLARQFDANHILVTVGVWDSCRVGDAVGDTPAIAGLQQQADQLVVVVTRSPMPPGRTCATFSGRDFDIVVDVRSIPDAARRIVLGGEACDAADDLCNRLSAPMPFEAPTIPPPSD
jgi:hypothetical protein